jgi:hypothetical protein
MLQTKQQITLALPGVVFLGEEDFKMSVYAKDDTPAHRWRFDVRGHNVQIIAMQGSEYYLVWVGNDVQQLKHGEIKRYVQEQTK